MAVTLGHHYIPSAAASATRNHNLLVARDRLPWGLGPLEVDNSSGDTPAADTDSSAADTGLVAENIDSAVVGRGLDAANRDSAAANRGLVAEEIPRADGWARKQKGIRLAASAAVQQVAVVGNSLSGVRNSAREILAPELVPRAALRFVKKAQPRGAARCFLSVPRRSPAQALRVSGSLPKRADLPFQLSTGMEDKKANPCDQPEPVKG